MKTIQTFLETIISQNNYISSLKNKETETKAVHQMINHLIWLNVNIEEIVDFCERRILLLNEVNRIIKEKDYRKGQLQDYRKNLVELQCQIKVLKDLIIYLKN